MTLDDEVVEVGGVADHPRGAVDPQGVAAAGDDEEQADVRVGEHVEVPVDATVAGTLGQHQRPVVEHVHEPGGVALG